MARAPRTLWWLVAANLVPLVGVLVAGWDLGLVLLLYWAESGVIGFYAILRLAIGSGWTALFLVPFFCIHFGMFMFVHLVFIVALFIAGPLAGDDASAPSRLRDAGLQFLLFVPFLFSSHGYSFAKHFPQERAAPRGGPDQALPDSMARPFSGPVTAWKAPIPRWPGPGVWVASSWFSVNAHR